LVERDHLAPPEIGMLYEQAVASQWNAASDIPWHTIRPLPEPLESALGQVMTFLAENELAALYVPARFLPRIHPAYAEVAQFLATQLVDVARHIDVFLKRARTKHGTCTSGSPTLATPLHTIRPFQGASRPRCGGVPPRSPTAAARRWRGSVR
jgi:hypothetical protein